jgi:hypothetical protein
LTICCGEAGSIDLVNNLEKTIIDYSPIILQVGSIGFGNNYTKSLYINLEPDTFLFEIAAKLKDLFTASDFALNPHLSLMYSNYVSLVELQDISTKIILQRNTIKFERVKIVRTPSKTKSIKDFEHWEILLDRLLK